MSLKFLKSIFLLIGLMLIACPAIVFADVSNIEMAIMQEDYPQAQKLAEEFLQTKPDVENGNQAMYFLGLSYLRQGKTDEARDIFNQLVKAKINKKLQDKSFIGLFDAYFIDEQFHDAEKIIKKLLRKNTNSEFLSLIYLKAARVNLKLAHWSEAREYLNKIINEFPESLEVYTARQLMEEEQYFTVQVGAFAEQSRAEKLIADLLGQGEYAYMVETKDRQDKTLFRVRVGKNTLLADAQKLKSKLTQKGYPAQIYP